MLQPLAQSIASLSVRTRIIGLALIPVVGFLANGIAFTPGQSEVTDAFASLADAFASLADTLSQEAESLDAEVRRFLTDVQAA